MPIAECIVCGEDIPEHCEGRATCSRDCLVSYRVTRWRAQRREKLSWQKNGHGLAHKPINRLQRLRAIQNQSRGKHKRNCDYCGTEFMAVNTRQYFCTPQCVTLTDKFKTSDSSRRVPSMPKMPWDE